MEKTFTEQEVISVLKRLARYYKGRTEAALKGVAEQKDAQQSANLAVAAAMWEAKRDAIYVVAGNLEISLPEQEQL